jgi:hypothetical protein
VQSAMPPHSQHSQPQPQTHQHSPPLSAGHDMAEQSVQYNKHDGVYARPGIPLSAQVAPVPGSVNTGPALRGEDTTPHSPVQTRRPRPPSTNMSAARDGRPSHVGTFCLLPVSLLSSGMFPEFLSSSIQHVSIKPAASKRSLPSNL